jgi:hypothetical protein
MFKPFLATTLLNQRCHLGFRRFRENSMFRDLAVTALSAVGTAILLYALVKSMDFFKAWATKIGPVGDILMKVVAASLFVVPMLYFFRQAGWI